MDYANIMLGLAVLIGYYCGYTKGVHKGYNMKASKQSVNAGFAASSQIENRGSKGKSL